MKGTMEKLRSKYFRAVTEKLGGSASADTTGELPSTRDRKEQAVLSATDYCPGEHTLLAEQRGGKL